MLSRTCLALFSVSLLLTPAAAQTTGLVGQVGPGNAGRNVTSLVNHHAATARHYIVECTYTSASGDQRTVDVAHVGFSGPPFAVSPQGSQLIACPPSTSDAAVLAVIYDDGFAEGDASDLANLVLARQKELAEVTQALGVLNNAKSAATIDGGQLAGAFVQLAVQEEAAGATMPQGHFNRWVAQTILMNHRQSLPTQLNNLIHLLTSYVSTLQQPIPGVAQR